MSKAYIQVPGVILPLIPDWNQFRGTETEAIDELVTHVSVEIPVKYIQEKTIHISAMEAVAGGLVPGPLWCWVELSPYPSTISAAYWSAIGGGGGALPPLAPFIEVGAGVNLRVHTIILPWQIHSEYARLVVQTPVAANLPFAFWGIQAIFCGGTK